MSNHIIPYQHQISQSDRTAIKQHQPLLIWLTGLSGSGKSTIANTLERRLNKEFGLHTYLLDGDNIRIGLNADLGFSDTDREENIRRIGEVAKLMVDAGLIVITAFISPFQRDRDRVRTLLPAGQFWEVYVECPLEICEQRDPKRLYAKARLGQIPEFTGVTSPYESPHNPELVLHTARDPLEDCVNHIIQKMIEEQIIKTVN
ncbi:MAG: adenylyl-sulfate kinase [Chloroflexi bacterium HGW-Chloroflexi-3]|nr:MAG: adenylyl-sulfate kinase [Chloroflexi bacterium HGW-Chloroflexi-3]